MSDSPIESTKELHEKRFHCNRCGKDVVAGAHTCLKKREIVEIYRSPNAEIQNFDYAPERIALPRGDEELKEALAEVDRLHALSLRLRA